MYTCGCTCMYHTYVHGRVWVCIDTGLLWWLSGKEPACQLRRFGFNMSWEDPLEKELSTHSSILASEIPWTEEPMGYRPWVRKRPTQLSNWTPPPHTCIHLSELSVSSYFLEGLFLKKKIRMHLNIFRGLFSISGIVTLFLLAVL